MPVYDGLVTDFYTTKQKEHLCLPTIEVASIECSLAEFQISRAFLAQFNPIPNTENEFDRIKKKKNQ